MTLREMKRKPARKTARKCLRTVLAPARTVCLLAACAVALSASRAARATAQGGGKPTVAVQTGATQDALNTGPVRLVRCLPRINAACLSLSVTLPAAVRASMAALDSAGEVGAWSATVLGARLVGPGITTAASMAPPLKLLILVDESAAMGATGLTFARIALSSFVRALDTTAVSVAFTTFGSRRVSTTIDSLAFTAPRDALHRIDDMPQSAEQPRSALYSAVSLASARAAREANAHPGSQAAVLVLTAGQNDGARRGDDPGLLSGSNGLREAATGIAASNASVWIVHVHVAEAPSSSSATLMLPDSTARALTMLCGAAGRVLSTRRDPNAMASALQALARTLRPKRTLVFAAPALPSTTLARTAWTGSALLQSGEGSSLVLPLPWRPPLFALPVFAGATDAASLPAELREVLSTGAEPANSRPLIALVMALAGLALWMFVPRLFWGGQSETADDLARRTAFYRTASNTQELVLLRGPAPREGEPRSPHAPTVQTEHVRRPSS